MAFDRPRGQLGITFEPEPLAGLKVQFRPPTVAAFAAVVDLGDYSPVETITVEAVIALRPVCEQFASLLLSWNYEQGGVPVPVSEFLSLDAMFVMRVAKTWARVTFGLPQIPAAEQDDDDEDEPAFTEADLPMVPLEAVS